MRRYIINFVVLLVAITVSPIANADTCWKASYGRGVGVIPSHCNYDQAKSGLLCYPPCKAGYTLVAGVCWQQCAAGFTDTGAHCLKGASYGRGAGYPLGQKDQCERDQKPRLPTFLKGAYCAIGNNMSLPTCAEYRAQKLAVEKAEKEGVLGCEQSGALWYPQCKKEFHPVGCCVCSPDCQPGTKDIGVSCQKDSYVVPPITPNCGAQQYDAGLCYDQCRPNYNGIGPVCWGICPKGMVDCGALCGSSVGDCVSAIGDMVMSVGSVVSKIAETVLTLGATTGIEAAADAAMNSAINTIKQVAKKAAKQFAGMAAAQIKAKVSEQISHLNLPPGVADKLAAMHADPEGFDYASFLKGLDPTGITKVVDAFSKKICSVEAGPPAPPPTSTRPTTPVTVVTPLLSRAEGPNPCAKMLAHPRYGVFDLGPGGQYADNLWSERAWQTARAIVAEATGLSAGVTAGWPKIQTYRLLKANCNTYVRDPNYSNVVKVPADKWSNDQRNMAISIVSRGTGIDVQLIQSLNNWQLLGLLRGR